MQLDPERSLLGARGTVMLKENVEPTLGTLSTAMFPPIAMHKFLLIAKPKPVPPYLRAVDESTC